MLRLTTKCPVVLCAVVFAVGVSAVGLLQGQRTDDAG